MAPACIDREAERANVGVSTVRQFEKGNRIPFPNNLEALRRAIEDGGVRLLFDEQGCPTGIARSDPGRAT